MFKKYHVNKLITRTKLHKPGEGKDETEAEAEGEGGGRVQPPSTTKLWRYPFPTSFSDHNRLCKGWQPSFSLPTPTPLKLYTNPVKGSQILVGTRDICSA